MGLHFNTLILYSKNPEDLARFYSDLFDFEILPHGPHGGIQVKGQGLAISILPHKASQLFALEGERDMVLDIGLNDLAGLEEILQKVQFQSYRQGAVGAMSQYTIEKNDNYCFFQLKDPEGRMWRFSCPRA